MKKTHRCKECHAVVSANFDHVGNCESGACAGTYAHPRKGAFAHHCALENSDVGHAQVFTSTLAERGDP